MHCNHALKSHLQWYYPLKDLGMTEQKKKSVKNNIERYLVARIDNSPIDKDLLLG